MAAGDGVVEVAISDWWTPLYTDNSLATVTTSTIDDDMHINRDTSFNMGFMSIDDSSYGCDRSDRHDHDHEESLVASIRTSDSRKRTRISDDGIRLVTRTSEKNLRSDVTASSSSSSSSSTSSSTSSSSSSTSTSSTSSSSTSTSPTSSSKAQRNLY